MTRLSPVHRHVPGRGSRFDLISQNLQGFEGIWIALLTDSQPGAAAPPSTPAAHWTITYVILTRSVHVIAPGWPASQGCHQRRRSTLSSERHSAREDGPQAYVRGAATEPTFRTPRSQLEELSCVGRLSSWRGDAYAPTSLA
jgi:hypothetical protein